jgi:TolB protein
MNVRIAVLLALLLTLAAVPASAQVTIDIFGPGQSAMRMVLLPPRNLQGEAEPRMAQAFLEHVRQNLSYLPFIEEVRVESIVGGDPSTGVRISEIDLRPLGLAKVDLVATMGWEGRSVQARVYETLQGRRLVGKAYHSLDDGSVGPAADAFCSAFMQALTGRSGFFNSDLAFVKKNKDGSEIFTVSPQGREVVQATRLGGFNLSPEWSKDGRKIIFTHVGERQHSLGILDRASGEARLKSFPGFTVISPAYLPDGSVAATLAYKGQPDIWHLSPDFKVQEPLAESRSIDVSPSFDRSGARMAFASGRRGNPHIFVKEMATGEVRRVTTEGKYNTSPCLSPDGRYVVFSRQLPGGHKLFVHDLATGQERQITFGPGSDEEPAFGPDGYFVAYASNRSGTYQIYMTTRHGDTPRHVPTGAGEAMAPAWDTSRMQ